MPTTVKYALNYPAGATAPNVPVSMQTSMESVEAALNGIAAENMGKGLIYKSVTSAPANGITGAYLAEAINPVVLKANRNYEIKYVLNCLAPSVANSAFSVNLRKSLTTDTGTTGTDIRAYTLWTSPTSNSGKTFIASTIYTPSADETVRILVSVQQLTGTGGVNIDTRYLSVTDLGKQI